MNQHIDFKKIWKSEDFELEAEHFFVKTEDGLKISAYEVSVDAPKAIIICLSGFAWPSATIYFGHARLFQQHGWATVLFDMRAHGESEGKKIGAAYKEWRDTKAIVEYIRKKTCYDNVPIIVLGFSMGASVAINSIGEIPEIDGLISISAYSDWLDVFFDKKPELSRLAAKVGKIVVSFGLFFLYGVDSLTKKPKNEIKKLGNRPALLMHSKKDSHVPYINFERLVKCAPLSIETFIREGDMHFVAKSFENPEKDPEYSKIVVDFIKNHFSR